MMPRSLEARLTLQQQGLAVLVIAVFAASALWLTSATLFREETHMLESTAQRLAGNLDLELDEEHDLTQAADSVMSEELHPGVAVTITDSTGHVLVVSDEAVRAGAGTPAPPGELHRVRARAQCGAWVETSVSDRARKATIAALARALLIAALPLLLLSFVISRWTVRRALRPLEDMTHRAGAVSLEPGARTLGGDGGLVELERLREAFDRLLARLGEQLRAERQFASDASHELRTPLTVLSGEIELALADPTSTPTARLGLERALEQVLGMRDLIEALLLLRRAGDDVAEAQRVFEPVDLSDVVDTARREVLAHYPDRRADIDLQAALDVVVSGHAVLLTAGLRNLLDNALKFTPPGTAVRVVVDADATSAFVRVDDAGVGVTDEDRERVFDPFFRGAEARASSGGFGLGLPILRRVARAHGGDVTIERSPLGGAGFVLRLPRWRSAPVTPARISARD